MAAVTAMLDFQKERLEIFLIIKSPQHFLSSYESVPLSLKDNYFEIGFQDSSHGGQLGFFNLKDFSYFYLQEAPIFPNKFRVNLPFGSGED